MSTILVNNIKDTGNNTLLTSDGSGNISSGGAITNTPTFEVTLSANQTLSDASNTKIQFDTVNFDTNSDYDATNYRYIPSVAGKYFVYFNSFVNTSTDAINDASFRIYKNGDLIRRTEPFQTSSNQVKKAGVTVAVITEMNGSTDYLEAYVRVDVSTGTSDLNSGTNLGFGAYKLIGA